MLITNVVSSDIFKNREVIFCWFISMVHFESLKKKDWISNNFSCIRFAVSRNTFVFSHEEFQLPFITVMCSTGG